MNLLDLMEFPEQAPQPASASRHSRELKCQCPDFYYPTMSYDTKVKSKDVNDALRSGNVRKLYELGVRYYNNETRKWASWTSRDLAEFKKTARPFPKCDRSRE